MAPSDKKETSKRKLSIEELREKANRMLGEEPGRNLSEQKSPDEKQADLTAFESNPVYKIINDPASSQKEKIESLAALLTAKDRDYSTARKTLAQFEEYFHHLQNESMKNDLQEMQVLIEELRNALKPEIEKIAKDIAKVQSGIHDTQKMMTVIREARKKGMTVDEVIEALEKNERLLSNIRRHEKSLSLEQEAKTKAQKKEQEAQSRQEASRQGALNRILRAVTGPDKQILAELRAAQEFLDKIELEISKTQEIIEGTRSQRDEELENGPLTILRSIDATEEGFTHKLVETAESGITLIKDSIASINRLLKRTRYSEQAAHGISEKIQKAMIDHKTMSAALQIAGQNTEEQKTELEQEVKGLDQKLEAMSQDETGHAITSSDRLKVKADHKDSLAYLESLNNMLATFSKVDISNTEIQCGADQFINLVGSQKQLLVGLATEALPGTNTALRLALEEIAATQTGECAMLVSDVATMARETAMKSLSRLAESQGELHDVNAERQRNAIESLRQSEEIIRGQIETDIEQSRKTAELMDELSNTVNQLKETTEAYGEIHVVGSFAQRPNKRLEHKKGGNDASGPS